MRANGTRRERGAFFTPSPISALLAKWAIRRPADIALDPACGVGDLLSAACGRLARLGAKGPYAVHGVELHTRTHRRLVASLSGNGVPPDHLVRGDFFSVLESVRPVDAVIANPPFVRHQAIPLRALGRMKVAAARHGVAVDGKASSWAYFLALAPMLLREGGRLAFVLPVELMAADYAKPILDDLRMKFSEVRLLSCTGFKFSELPLHAVLLLADGYGTGKRPAPHLKIGATRAKGARLLLPREAALARLREDRRRLCFASGVTEAFVAEARELLRDLAGVRRVEDVAHVGIGYVTGASSFFHLSEVARQAEGLLADDLTRVVRRGSQLRGIRFDLRDWRALRDGHESCWLFTPRSRASRAVDRRLRSAAAQGVRSAAKCASRKVWWRVPSVCAPDAFLVGIGNRQRIVSNAAGVLASNSLLALSKAGLPVETLAVGSMTSTFQLSAMLESRHLGGGLAKLEPSDARRLLVPDAPVEATLVNQVDRLVRLGHWREAVRAADGHFGQALGWSPAVSNRLRELAASLTGAGMP